MVHDALSDGLDQGETIAGYQIVRELGRGATSVVYLAERDGQEYALKALSRASGSVADSYLQFRREAAAIARLRHPSLVRVIEVGEEDGQSFLVMGLVEGESLDIRLQRGVLDEDTTLDIARSITSALAEVHRMGLVHRDIKPANTLISPDGTVTIIDFGMVADTEDDLIVGTVHYAPPEQLGVVKRAVAAPADLYALGSMLFECMTGYTPLSEGDPGELVHRIATTVAPDLAERVPGIRPSTAHIVARLLRKDPDDRYQSAIGLQMDLDRLDEIDGALQREEDPALHTHTHGAYLDVHTKLIGRETEVQALDQAWKRASDGNTTFMEIAGAAGSGKTRLGRELLDRIDGEILVLHGKCQEQERNPFGPLRQAVDELIATVSRQQGEQRARSEAQIKQAAGAQASVLKKFSPALAAVLGETPPVRELEPAAEQLRFLKALAGFFGHLATSDRPLVLFLDDLHWLDEGSLQVLGSMAEHSPKRCMLVVATCRPMDEAKSTNIRNAMASCSVPRLDLTPLDRQDASQLVAAYLGGRPLDGDIFNRLHALTQGNPFAVGEYLRALLDRGIVHPVADGWTANADELDSVHLPADVVQLIVGRLEKLDDSVRQIVRMAAMFGRTTTARLAAALDIEPQVVVEGLQQTRRLGLVELLADGRWTFHHDRARAAVTEAMTDEERRDAHQAIADVLSAESSNHVTDLYDLARHLGLGHVDRDPQRVCDANLRAGLAALDEHAYESAYAMLSMAEETTRQTGSARSPMLAALGRTAVMTGRHEKALTYLEEAQRYVTDQHESFNLMYLRTLTYASQGQNLRAQEMLYETCAVLGRPIARTTGRQILGLISVWLTAQLLHWTGYRRSSATGEEHDQRLVQSRLNYAGTMISMFQSDTILMLTFIMRDFRNVHYLLPCAEKAIAQTVYGAVLGTLHLESTMERYTQAGVDMATELGDKAALAVCHAYQAMGRKWTGSLDDGNDLLIPTLDDLNRELPGSWYAAMMITEQAYSFLHAGRTIEAAALFAYNDANLKKTNNHLFCHNSILLTYTQMVVRGDYKAAAEYHDANMAQYEGLEAGYATLAESEAYLEVMVDREEIGPEFDAAVTKYEPCFGEDYYSFYPRVLQGIGRYEQFKAADDATRPARRKQLQTAITRLRMRAPAPVFACHVEIWRAAIAREAGKLARADRHLMAAQEQLNKVISHLGDYFLAVERAELALARGDGSEVFFAQRAYDIAVRCRWKGRAARVARRFDTSTPTRTPTGKSTVSMSPGAESAQRYVDALLQVSLASASTVDESAQAHQVLEAVANVLGAERALLYLFKGDELVLESTAGTGAEAVSSTVVGKVVETREPIVLTGNDAGGNIGSSSILTYGLRSVMAAPIILRETMIGVVYVDSRLAKGMFSQDELQLLQGLSSHIAIAIEGARNVRLEAERARMAKDFELVGVVQDLMLPPSPTFAGEGITGRGHVQPAAKCGGDWWWHERQPDGSVYLWLGDVSGHGVAPAMIASTVAGAFHATRSMDPTGSPEDVIRQLDMRIAAMGGAFHMTMTVLHLQADKATLWNAGGPTALVLQQGQVSTLSVRGDVVGNGMESLDIGKVSMDLLPGDRVLMCTDGVYEIEDSRGRAVGPRGVSKWLKAQEPGMSVDALCEGLLEHLNERLDGQEQDDDITTIIAGIGVNNDASNADTA